MTDTLEEFINEARAEYKRNEIEDPVLLDGTSEMHAREFADWEVG